MASTLILTGGSATQRTVKEQITQVAHGFVPGQAVRYDTSLGRYVLAQANSAANSEVVGVIETTPDNDTFELIYAGYIDLPAAYSGISLPVLFLSTDVAGGLTGSPPSYVGSVVKPVVTRNTSGVGHIVTNYLGTQIGGSSTVAIDQIQPVGTIMPYAGSVVPDTWLRCDGVSYSTSAYGELYDKTLYDSGARAPMYGHVVTLATNASTGFFAVNDRVRQGGSDTAPGIVGTVISAGSGNNPTITVQINAIYDSTAKNFSFPNTVFTPGGAYKIGNATAFSVVSAAITHFNTPNLSGRFPVGTNTTAIADGDGDAAFSSAISAGYTLGSFGGQQDIAVDSLNLGSGTSGKYTATANSATGSIRNVPPYLATQYIIKAKPYARAALIEGIDFPYDKLLVRDLRTRNYGGQNFPLDFYMNQSGDSGTGTLVMRAIEKTAAALTEPSLVIGATTGNNAGRKVTIWNSGTGEPVLRLASPTGYADIGSKNGTYFHIETTSPRFYFNSPITVNGDIGAYSTQNLTLSINNTTVLYGKYSTGSDLGFIGIGNSAPTERLHVTGNILATGDVTAFSDERLKTDVVRIDSPMERLHGIEGVLYTDTEGNRKTGVIAQQVQKVLPEVVHGTSGGYMSVAYGNMVGLLVECIKEQQQQIDQLKAIVRGNTQ